MKRNPLLPPWNGCFGYQVFHKKEGRMMLVVILPDGKRTTTSLARYKLSVKIGRKLYDYEFADHIDEDKTNDDINNLQILSRSENNKKHVRLSNKASKMICLTCPVCHCEFSRPPRSVNYKIKNGKKISCSRRCGSILSHRNRNKGA